MSNDFNDEYLGSLGGAVFDDGAMSHLTERMLDNAADHLSAAPSFSAKVAEPQPINQATHVCLRGPCLHYWSLVARFESGDDEIRRQALTSCTHFVGEETPLSGQNVYQCSQWWPSPFLWVPESVRAVLRASLEEAWEWFLRRRGYDFSWRVTDGRTWQKDDFLADAPDRRGDAGLGGATPGKVFAKSARR
jgi:hypothetical protein